MEALRELEQRLNIAPLDFNRKWEDNSSQPVKIEHEVEKTTNKNETKVSDKEEFVVLRTHDEEAFLDSTQINFTAISNKWRVLKSNVINIYDQIKNVYKTTNNECAKNLCRVLLTSMLHNDLSKDEFNDLVNEINGMDG